MYEDVQTRYNYAHSNLKKPPQVRLEKMWRSSRDSARTPVQWDATENAGFTTGKPWFYVNQNYHEINAAKQEADPNSLLNFYRKAIALRKSLPVVKNGKYRDHFFMSGKRYVYSRDDGKQKLLVMCSFSKTEIPVRVPAGFDLNKAKLVLQSYPDVKSQLQPYEVRVYLWE
jgi:oligo-1,6-glucosidase